MSTPRWALCAVRWGEDCNFYSIDLDGAHTAPRWRAAAARRLFMIGSWLLGFRFELVMEEQRQGVVTPHAAPEGVPQTDTGGLPR